MSTAPSKTNRNNGKSPPSICYIEDWDKYFLWIAEAVARKSKDPNCQVGAVIVSPDKLVLSTGFNGLARGVWDHEEILANTDEKLPRICHAEVNAIVNAARTGISLRDCTIFVNKFPCLSCCNAIVQAGIVKIYTHDDWYWDDDPADDEEHRRKWETLKQADVQVVAPYHPHFGLGEPVSWPLKNCDQRPLAGIGAKKRLAGNGAKKPARKSGVKLPKRRRRNGNVAKP